MDNHSTDSPPANDIPVRRCSRISIRRHAFEQMYTRKITEEEVEKILLCGEILEEYPDDYPLPSVLICGYSHTRMLHVVAAFNKDADEFVVITAYEPDELHFESGRTRRTP